MEIRMRVLLGIIAAGSLLIPAFAAAQIIPPEPEAYVSMAYEGIQTLSLFNLPDGTGHAFNQAYLPGGGTADATITLVLYDGYGSPIANYPGEDMWIGSVDGGMVACYGTARADVDTDAEGMTYWAQPLLAGGFSETLCIVFINGSAVTSSAGLALSFNSADMDGSGVVNLTDVGLFAEHIGTAYYGADFTYDGIVNISDAGMMAGALGITCP